MINGITRISPQQSTHTKKIQNYLFDSRDILGCGNFSKVYKGINALNGNDVAVKVVQLKTIKATTLAQLLHSEIEILKTLRHSNIITFLEAFTSANNCYIVTELCNEGDLQTKLKKTGFIEQPHAKKYFFDVYQALKYLSQQNIVHRDLKIANICLDNGIAKLADFGFAKRNKQHFIDHNIGSPVYMSPEGLLTKMYGPKTDIWAFGIFMFQMTQGYLPLQFCKTQAQLKQNIMIPLTEEQFRRPIPNSLKDLILKCLQINQEKRISIKQIQFHPYMKSLFNEYQQQQIALQSPLSIITPRGQLPRKECCSTSISFKFQQKSLKSRSIAPSILNKNNFKYSHSNNNLIKNKSSNSLSTNNTNTNITNQSIKHHNHSKQKVSHLVTPELNRKDMLVSMIKFEQCIKILHYCRLVCRCIKQLHGSQFIALKYHLVNFLLDLIYELQIKVDTHVKFEGSKAVQRQQKMKVVVKQYYQKYNKQFKRVSKITPTLQNLNILLIQALKDVYISLSKKQRPENLTLGNYLVTLFESNKILQKSISTKNYKYFVQEINIQNFLNSSLKSDKTIKAQEIKIHIKQLITAD